MHYKYIISVLLLLIFSSCNGRKSKIERNIENLYRTQVILHLDSMQCMQNGKETISDDMINEFKMVVLADSNSCTPCMYRSLYRWNEISESVLKARADVGFVFIFQPSKSSRVFLYHEMLQPNIFKEKVYIDTTGIFLRDNPDIPAENLYHTFVLDSDNRIVMVGNPMQNEKLKELFMKTITKNK